MRPCLLMGGLLLVVGCGRSNIAPVSGRVTLNDKPLVHATVIFQPDSAEKNPGPGSVGKTDAEGRFSLRIMTNNADGAILGKHQVSVTAYEGDDVAPSSGSDMVFRKALVPLKYNAQTELTFTVPPEGTTQANFELTTKPSPNK